MKRFVTLIALLAMMTILASGLTACGGSSDGGGESSNAVSGNWYLVDGSDIVTLKLDASGGGSLAGDPISYELADDEESLVLTIDGEDIDLEIEDDDEFGLVLEDGDQIYAYRDKDIAKEVAAGGTDSEYLDALLGDWYLPDEGELTTLTFKDGGVAAIDGVDVLTYTLSNDMVTLLAENGDSYTLWIEEDSAEGWVLTEANGDISAWKDKARAEAQVAATEPSDSGKEAFIGHWTGESFSYQGIEMSLSEAAMTFSIDINADGSATATTNGEADGSATWVYNSDGTITLTDSSGQLKPTYIDESGLLHLTLDADGEDMVIICHK